MLKAAQEYVEQKINIVPFTFIPTEDGKGRKVPTISWTPYQTQWATNEEIVKWFSGKKPATMLGAVTGQMSDLVTVDVDTDEGRQAIEEYIPDNLEIPTFTTPSGGYQMCFRAPTEKIPGSVRFLPGVDYRGEKSLAILPPSSNIKGKYVWIEGCPPLTERPELPHAILSLLLKNVNFYSYKACHGFVTPDAETGKMFELGRRDNDLFHVANYLAKSRMPETEIVQVLEMLVQGWGEKPDPKWISTKVESALKRAETRDRNLTQDVREWVSVTNGDFSVTDCVLSLRGGATVTNRDTIRQILHRLWKDGVTEKAGTKDGVYRRVETDIEIMDIFNAPTDEFELFLPLGVHQLCKIYPGNIIVVAGSKSAGKTAYLLNLVKENMKEYPIDYINSEMGETEFRNRLELFQDIKNVHDWKLRPIRRTHDWWDLITKEKKIFVIDYIEPPEDRIYMIGSYLRKIHEKLGEGIAVVGLQKRQGRDTGHGDSFSMEKARLYLALDYDPANRINRIKIVDAKSWRTAENPRGKVREYKLINGSTYAPQNAWHY